MSSVYALSLVCEGPIFFFFPAKNQEAIILQVGYFILSLLGCSSIAQCSACETSVNIWKQINKRHQDKQSADSCLTTKFLFLKQN